MEPLQAPAALNHAGVIILWHMAIAIDTDVKVLAWPLVVGKVLVFQLHSTSSGGCHFALIIIGFSWIYSMTDVGGKGHSKEITV